MGPTASGKTALAVALAQAIQGEVVSVDSALIYRDMNIGTAKPDIDEMQGIPHHLIDICSPQDSYSVAQFRDDAIACIDDVLGRNKIPILAGGTMMYFNALHQGISQIPSADMQVREQVQTMISEHGLAHVHAKLQEVDPISAAKIHQNDPQRLTRAMEVFISTNKPLSVWQQEKKPALEYDFYNFALMPNDRAFLHQRIATRFELMLEQGLVKELEMLLSKYDLNPDLPSMRSVGYRQVYSYLSGEYDYANMVEKGLAATRQLAKRQMTWLRGWEDTTFMDIQAHDLLRTIMKKVT
ncbi:tRNA (adenosine(37)-N6)-dimethylallyltransferase MiaA [Glaciecola siphonariae]|uniref:tRNA dimethylallyltransferase n=1 Tax=Glaciecola siphonariae TaxID=521012 RepID=A0ABV9LZ59_9ALTE